MLNDSNLINIV